MKDCNFESVVVHTDVRFQATREGQGVREHFQNGFCMIVKCINVWVNDCKSGLFHKGVQPFSEPRGFLTCILNKYLHR